jgi:hypothetical protein
MTTQSTCHNPTGSASESLLTTQTSNDRALSVLSRSDIRWVAHGVASKHMVVVRYGLKRAVQEWWRLRCEFQQWAVHLGPLHHQVD